MEYLQYDIFILQKLRYLRVLNLVINGIPSIHIPRTSKSINLLLNSFKPCYKWNTFNTNIAAVTVLEPNLWGFKPCYKWNTFNT